MFLGIILRVVRLEVSVYNVYISNQFRTSFEPILLLGGGGNSSVKMTVNSKTLKTFVLISSKNLASGIARGWGTSLLSDLHNQEGNTEEENNVYVVFT
jgi:hypothetical protein